LAQLAVIPRRPDQSLAKVQLPHAIHYHAGGKRIARIGNSVREVQTAAALREWLRGAVAQDRKKAPGSFFAKIARFAANRNLHICRLLLVANRDQERILLRQSLLQHGQFGLLLFQILTPVMSQEPADLLLAVVIDAAVEVRIPLVRLGAEIAPEVVFID